MYRTVAALILLTLYSLLSSPSTLAQESPKPTFTLAEVLPTGTCDMQVLDVAFSPRANELAAKLKKGAESNPQWFTDYVKQAKPGEPLPYHPNMGITKDEYEEFLREGKKRQVVFTGKTVHAQFIRDGNVLRLSVDDESSPLSKIRINLDTGEATASAGELGKPTWSSSDSPEAAIGPWDGYSWQFSDADMQKGNIRGVRLQMLRVRQSGRILLRLVDAEVIENRPVHNMDILLQLPEKGSAPAIEGRNSVPPKENAPASPKNDTAHGRAGIESR